MNALPKQKTWHLVKQRAFQDPDINLEIKTDLWNAAIGSILRYGITTLTTSKKTDQMIQRFATKCLHRILLNKPDDAPNTPTEHKIKNIERRKEIQIATQRSEIQKENSVTYIDGKQQSHKPN